MSLHLPSRQFLLRLSAPGSGIGGGQITRAKGVCSLQGFMTSGLVEIRAVEEEWVYCNCSRAEPESIPLHPFRRSAISCFALPTQHAPPALT